MSLPLLPHLLDIRFGRFLLVGGVCAAIDVGTVAALLRWFTNYHVVITTGFLVGLLANFLLHTSYTFGMGRGTVPQASRFVVVVALNYGLTMLLVWVVHEGLGRSVLLGKLVSLPVVAINGFLLAKLWVYRRTGARL